MSQENVEIVRRAYSLAKESETYSFVAANQDLYDEYFHHDAELMASTDSTASSESWTRFGMTGASRLSATSTWAIRHRAEALKAVGLAG